MTHYICYFLELILCIYFLAALGLHYCARAFSSCDERGLFFIVVRGLLIAVASLIAEHGLQEHGLQQLWHAASVAVARGLQSTGSVIVAHRLSCSATGMWDLPRPGLKPVSPALAGRFLTTPPPGKSHYICYLSTETKVVRLQPTAQI